ncbi:MAG: methyltransferase domain-containing protein [Balneolales bacterium]|nr:methyltransferase domain-containing protein [Balneolales bacterium]
MPDFSKRDTELRELMDSPDCDPTKLQRTYRQFGFVNRIFASWKSIFGWYILPDMLLAVKEAENSLNTFSVSDAINSGKDDENSRAKPGSEGGIPNPEISENLNKTTAKPEIGTESSVNRNTTENPFNAEATNSATTTKTIFTLLDVGCGLLDNGLFLQELANRHDIELHVTGVDPNPTTAAMLKERKLPKNVHFEQCYLSEVVDRGQKYDYVISNHLMHHLDDEVLKMILHEAAQCANRMVIMNDLRRSPISWLFYGIFTLPVRWYSFLSIDGMRSIRRSYTPDELRALINDLEADSKTSSAKVKWNVDKVWPFRQVIIGRKTPFFGK